MDFLTFLSSIIGSLAWPAIVIIILYYGRNDIIKLIRDLKSLKYDKLELLFEQKVEDAALQAEVIAENENEDIDNKYGEFSFLSPYEAVMKSFILLNESSYKALKRLIEEGRITSTDFSKYDNKKHPVVPTWTLLSTLRDNSLLNDDEINLFKELMAVRNMAAHKSDLNITNNTAKSYVNSVLTLIKKIENL